MSPVKKSNRNSRASDTTTAVSDSTNSQPKVSLDSWLQVLESRFGLVGFRAGQLEIIAHLMAGQSAAAIFPTGGGKSLCYQFPAYLLEGLTIVVSPLLALMREQVDNLNRLGIPACRLDSTLTAQEAAQASQAIRQGSVKLLYVAPERFFNERFRETIQGVRIALFAVDEAHCISQWGHNFRPDYLKLAQIAKRLQAERILALTATATPQVLEDICQQFGIDRQNAVRTDFYRDNLKLAVSLCNPDRRQQLLFDRLTDASNLPAIVYVTLQKTAEEVAEKLSERNFQARAYHAGLKDEQRLEIQDWFMNTNDGIVVATIAFGMGIDKSNIRSIVHFNPSKSVEAYAQEIGRGGRDNLPTRCETLLVPEDRVVLENFAYGDTPTESSVRQFVRIIAGQPEEFYLSVYALAGDTDIRDVVIRTLMTNLELRGFVQSTAPRYDLYKFKPKVNSAQILRHFDGERRQFAGSVLAMSVKKRVYCEIDLPHVATRLKVDRLRIVRMLEYFDQHEWIELEASGLVHGYRKLQPITNVGELSAELCQYVSQREAGEIHRLNQLFSLLAGAACLSRKLSEHFGQPLTADCGKCSSCNGNPMLDLPAPNYARVGDSARTAVNRLKKLHPELLNDRRAQARFLCGLTSPKFTRARLSRDSSFGCCSEIPFSVVLDSLESTE